MIIEIAKQFLSNSMVPISRISTYIGISNLIRVFPISCHRVAVVPQLRHFISMLGKCSRPPREPSNMQIRISGPVLFSRLRNAGAASEALAPLQIFAAPLLHACTRVRATFERCACCFLSSLFLSLSETIDPPLFFSCHFSP